MKGLADSPATTVRGAWAWMARNKELPRGWRWRALWNAVRVTPPLDWPTGQPLAFCSHCGQPFRAACWGERAPWEHYGGRCGCPTPLPLSQGIGEIVFGYAMVVWLLSGTMPLWAALVVPPVAALTPAFVIGFVRAKRRLR